MIDEAHVIGDWGANIIPTFQLLPMIEPVLFRNRSEGTVALRNDFVEEEAELITLSRRFTSTGLTTGVMPSVIPKRD